MDKEEILKELEKAPYDFVANNYYKLDKEELKNICLEAIYQLDETQTKNMLEELKDRL